jgi:hypothetical protein
LVLGADWPLSCDSINSIPFCTYGPHDEASSYLVKHE